MVLLSLHFQYNLPIKIFILNNEYMGMVRQWQELLHDKNYSESYTAALPDFLKVFNVVVKTDLISPTIARSTFTFLFIDDGSISI